MYEKRRTTKGQRKKLTGRGSWGLTPVACSSCWWGGNWVAGAGTCPGKPSRSSTLAASAILAVSGYPVCTGWNGV